MQGLTTLWAGLAALSLVGAPAGRVEAQGTATFIQNLGSSGNTSARTLTLTTTGAVAAGHAIIVVVAFGPGNASSVFCSDPINGTYVPGGSGGDGAPLGNTPCYLLPSAALPAGTPITINAGAEATRATAVAYEFANLVAVLGGGGAGTGTNTTNLNDPLGLTPIAAPALLFGGYSLAGTQAAPPTFIPGTNGTST